MSKISIEDKIREIKLKSQALDRKDDIINFSNIINKNNTNVEVKNNNAEKSNFSIKNFEKTNKLDLNPIDKIEIKPSESKIKKQVNIEMMTDDIDMAELLIDVNLDFKQDFTEAQSDKDQLIFKNRQSQTYEVFSEVQSLKEPEANSLLKDLNFSNKLSRKLQNLEAVLDYFDNNDNFKDQTDKIETKLEFNDEVINQSDQKLVEISESRKRPINAVKMLNNCIVASQGYSSESKSIESGGIVCMQDININQQAKAVLEAQTNVNCLAVDPEDPNVLQGGLQSGQLAKWDLRDKKTPVMLTKTTDLKQGDKFQLAPVLAVDVARWQNQQQVVSCASDGRVCQFNIKDFRFIVAPDWGHEEVQQVSAFATPRTDMSAFAVASLLENIHMGEWKSKSSSRAHDPKVLGRHLGQVTCMDQVQVQSKNLEDDINFCLLSSSSDGSVKLWNHHWSTTPLSTFHTSEDFLTAVRWLPVNACMFAVADSQGSLFQQNMEQSMEEPKYTDVLNQGRYMITDLCEHHGVGYNNMVAGDQIGNVYQCKSHKETERYSDKFKQKIRYLRDELNLLKDFNNY